MKIHLPAIRSVTNVKNNPVIKYILRVQQIEASVAAHTYNRIAYYTFRHFAQDYLIVIDSLPKSILRRYAYVLVLEHGTFTANLSGGHMDLTAFRWLKHPLLERSFLQRFTRDLVYESWNGAFTLKTDDQGEGLRVPQAGAVYAIQAHWTVSREAGIVVLPTGTGKTDTMIAIMIMDRTHRLLIVVPTDALREQLTEKVLTLGVLPPFGMVSDACESPVTGLMKHGFVDIADVDAFFDETNVIIATMQVLAGCPAAIQMHIASKISHLFIDEAHHTPATTWRTFRDRFVATKLLLFTATPFRNDGKRLEGKIIYNFPLRRAQELEYFKPIVFRPVHEYEYKLADRKIAETAITQLKADLDAGYDHILMVRVNEIDRANEILPLYSIHSEFDPVMVHSRIKPKSLLRATIRDVVDRKHRIIICVDMLGEGFDLPELKIAAFHDTRKSLTITLQIAGRFTRVKPNLGPATFIANIADPQVAEDLEDLYYRDADWNVLLPDLSYQMTLEQEDFRNFLEGFRGFPDKFPVQSIRHPLSTIIFRTASKEWKPLHFRQGITGIDSYEYVYSDYNPDYEILILILGKRSAVKWAKVQDFEGIEWNLIVCYFDKDTRLLYLHASNTQSYYERLVEAICQGAQLLKGETIFRCFAHINRIRLHNVGVREPLGRAINFIMRVGSDIKTALRDTELKKAIKSNVFGVGFEGGTRVSIGCSHHGRVWSMRTNPILTWMNWCRSVAAKITDETIDPDLVLRGSLIPQETDRIPAPAAFCIEWPDKIFRESIGDFYINYVNEEYPVWNCDLLLVSQTGTTIEFQIQLPSGNHSITLELFTSDQRKDFRFTSNADVSILDGTHAALLTDFFNRFPPLIYFVDGSFLEGNLFTKVEQVIPSFSVDRFILKDWRGVNLRKESQTYSKLTDSIQYYLIQQLIREGQYNLLMDDDGTGEIADVVGFRIHEPQHVLAIDLYHCKYSAQTTAGLRVKDFYEVCGQAQRSIKWMERPDEIFHHLGMRSRDRLNRLGVSRFEIGTEEELDLLKRRARKDLKVKMNVFIVQPGLSFGDYDESSEISRLLAVVQNYLKETWNVELKVWASE